MSAKEHIFEAEARGDAAGYARGRAEALAELRAASVPVYLWRRVDGAWEVCSEDDYGPATTADTRRRILYTHPPVAREAELAAKVERLTRALSDAHDTLTRPAWQNCASTHCERKQECRSPSECGGTGVPRAVRILGAALATTQEGKSHDQP